MKEGYWINYRTGRIFPVNEHEQSLREPGAAKKMGVPDKVISSFKKFDPVEDRDKFLLFVIQNSPLIRVRGHGDFVTFEYFLRNRQEPLDAIWEFGKQNAGPYTAMLIRNFATGESTQINFSDFEDAMDRGGYEALMRVACVSKMNIRKHIAAELLALSKKLLMFLF